MKSQTGFSSLFLSDWRGNSIKNHDLATFNEYVLGTEGSSVEDSVRRLTRYNDGLLAKAWNTIRDAVEMRSAIDTGDAEAVKAYKDLLRYEKVFRAALEARGVDLGTMAGRDEEEKTKFSLTKAKAERLEKAIDELGKKGISKKAGGKTLVLLTDKFTKNKALYSSKGRSNREINARIKAIPQFEEIIRSSEYSGTDTNIRNVETEAKKNVVAIHKFITENDDFNIEILVRDKGKSQYLYEIKFIEKQKSSQQSMTDKESASPAPNGDVENNKIVTQESQAVNTSEQNSSEKVFQSRKMNTEGMTAEQIEAEKLKRRSCGELRHSPPSPP